MKKLAEYFVESEQGYIRPQVGDSVDIVVNEELAIEAGVLESTEDKLVLEYDERGISLLEGLDLIDEEVNLDEEQTPSQVDEGKVKDMLLDIEEFTDKEFQDKYNMSKNDAKEQFDLDEASCGMKKRYEDASAEEEDKFHTELDKLMHRTFGHSSDERGEKMKKSTQDAFQELKDYAETSGGIDKEEFEKAAYLVKAMGKPHLKDKAEGMLDDLIGKMDSDPRDKVIQVLSQHIDLTFLKNLFKEDGDEKFTDKEIKMAFGILNDPRFKSGNMTEIVRRIEGIADGLSDHPSVKKAIQRTNEDITNEGAMKEVVTDVEDAMGPTKIRYKLKQKGGKFIVSVDSNDEEDAQKALKMHPLYVVGKLRVVPEEIDEAKYQGREVKLGKPMRGDVAKYKVYVKDKKTGNVKKVNFGDKNMEIKRDDPKRRKSFRARHGCGTPKASDRTKARYWSCRMWSSKPVSKII